MIYTKHRVRDTKTNEMAVCIPDAMGLCEYNELRVVKDGEENYSIMLVDEIEDLGLINDPPDLEKCEGCIFFVLGDQRIIDNSNEGQPLCGRYTIDRAPILFVVDKDNINGRHPTQQYPDCMEVPISPAAYLVAQRTFRTTPANGNVVVRITEGKTQGLASQYPDKDRGVYALLKNGGEINYSNFEEMAYDWRLKEKQ